LFFAFSCFGEGRKKGAMIIVREAFSGKYPIQSGNQNPTFINIKERNENKINRRLELEGAATLFSPKGVWIWYLRFSLSASFSSSSFSYCPLNLNWVFFSTVIDLSKFTLDMSPPASDFLLL
jgi:hypothetical protein